MHKKIIDISRPIYPGMTVWPKDENVKVIELSSMNKGSKYNLSAIKMGLHTGTHIDAPLHFIDEGNHIGGLDLSRFIGKAYVFEVRSKDCVSKKDIIDFPIPESGIVLFKTLNSEEPIEKPFNKEFIYLDISAAQYLVEKKVKTIGIDYLSIEKFNNPGFPIHKLLLSNNIGIIEGLYLKDVSPGSYFLSCLPLKLENVEGSPARAILSRRDTSSF